MKTKIDTSSKKVKEVLTRGVEKVLPSREKLARLMKKRKIRLYLGIDPTAPELHLGHAIPLRKLQQFQKLGHEVILLFGTFTAQIGDPSERDKKRKPLSLTQIKKNMATYKKQASKILNLSEIKVKYNAGWLAKLTFRDLVELTSYFTTSQLLERDMFQHRLKKGGEVWINEFLYPLLQGYDSVAMNVDLEIGSTDQIFNMLVGRKLQRVYNKKEKFVLTTPMLPGLDGRKMSKTFGNTVNIMDSADDMYGKLMSLRDDLIIQYFKLCAEVPEKKIKEIEKKLKLKKINPRDIKARLAREIVSIYHSKGVAQIAEKEFKQIFKEKKLPSKILEISIKEKTLNILDLLTKTNLASSKSEAKRLILQKGVKINGKLEEGWKKTIKIKKGLVLQIGKRKFVRLI
ncbi:tyrosine--tRNA ligase [Patescibacteria group bacterium]|nr:tyrosine--tRNA ligase [Patescibacteria group bacterium]